MVLSNEGFTCEAEHVLLASCSPLPGFLLASPAPRQSIPPELENLIYDLFMKGTLWQHFPGLLLASCWPLAGIFLASCWPLAGLLLVSSGPSMKSKHRARASRQSTPPEHSCPSKPSQAKAEHSARASRQSTSAIAQKGDPYMVLSNEGIICEAEHVLLASCWPLPGLLPFLLASCWPFADLLPAFLLASPPEHPARALRQSTPPKQSCPSKPSQAKAEHPARASR